MSRPKRGDEASGRAISTSWDEENDTERWPVNKEVDEEIQRRVRELRDEELVDFIRDTIAQLGNLAQRLERFVEGGEEAGGTRGA